METKPSAEAKHVPHGLKRFFCPRANAASGLRLAACGLLARRRPLPDKPQMPAAYLLPALLGLALLSCNLPAALAEQDAPAAEQPASPPEPPTAAVHLAPDERSESDAKALAMRFAQQLRQLQAGEESFAGFWLPANTAQPRGLVILLPSDGEHADWPDTIAPLRQRLPDAGWHTLSLTLPDPPAFESERPATPAKEDSPPEDEPTAASEGEPPEEQPPAETTEAGYLPEKTAPPQNEDTPVERDTAEKQPRQERKSRRERIDERITAALDFAREQNVKRLVLLGHGTGAYWAARYLGSTDTEAVDYLLVISPKQPVDADEEVSIAALGLPTADIYYKDDDIARQAARERRNESQRLDHANYGQIALSQLSADPDAARERLQRRVRGWLEKQLDAGSNKLEAQFP
ncbi:DUF3530 domain-containing protein [Stutzerimonas kirkiae]|nr:DUF3530 domain-containing protein [Stutzerimonas kirkiae]